jgi:2',3'-cyclic-nucleotide 2'-phosphodiesterase (5'-nucleotidase family)
VIDAKGTSGKPVRIGVLGVDRYNPVWQKAGPSGSNLAMLSPGEMIGKFLPELRKKSDIVVLLASIPKDDAHDLAKRFPDIDLILGAYGGIFNALEENEGRVRIYYTGNQGKRIGESRVTLDAKRRVDDVTSYIHFLTSLYPEDKATQSEVAAVVAKIPNTGEPQKTALPKKLAITPQATATGH